MKKTALIYSLWEKNLSVLEHYLQDRPRAVIVPDYLASAALRDIVEKRGSTLHLLPTDSASARTGMAVALVKRFAEGPASVGLAEDPVSRDVLRDVEEVVAVELPVIEGWLNVLTVLSHDYDIEITVLNEDVMRDGKTLALWSRAHEIPVLQVAHGTGMGRDYIGEPCLSDHMAVAGPRSAQYFEDIGIPADHIHVVGNSHWEMLPVLVANRGELRAQLAAAYSLPLAAHWVVWGSTWNARLSALDNRDAATQMHEACSALAALRKSATTDVVLVFKERGNGASGDRAGEQFMQIATSYGVADHVRYSVDEARYWAAAADVVVSYESNFAIEALLSDVPAINVETDFGAVAGGSFGARDGVLCVEAAQVAPLVQQLMGDATFRAVTASLAARRKSWYHEVTAVSAAARTAELISRCARKIASTQRYVWQEFLDVEHGDVAAAYHMGGREDLVALYTNNPSVALDIGCAGGSTAALIKQRFPQSRVWGVEVNRAAANFAKGKIDRVLVGKFEDFDLEAEGIAKGTLDAVLLADVLEHMYNPWDVMVTLRPYMSPTGQLVLSIPNVRNLMLIDDLSKGNWTYSGAGLLDITHIRFFTQNEVLRFCTETGYRVVTFRNAIDRRLEGFWNTHAASTPTSIETDRLTLKNVTRDELLELCTLQFYVVLEKDPAWDNARR
ncbi:class I SAM-dependent methyltransferase [Paraburkholderia sp. GAS334]|uniref:class I SAM-dependent methyltransferase n=1 Tax=Paraburkholderia sp. GAS334 TaxID=3035131 RepID=UPI003D23706B